MRKTSIALGLLLSLSGLTQAQENADYAGWVGGFVEYYNADQDKPEPLGYMDDGSGVGLEVGFRFKPQWALRLEMSHLNIDGRNNGPDESGNRLGLNAMYFLTDDLMYIFAGLNHEKLDQTYNMASWGLGKHWQVKDNWRVITEVAAYQEFGEGFNDYSIKVGLAYTFGNESRHAAPTTRPAPKDSDGDGIYDEQDACPNSLPTEKVDARGCSLDLDGDGVMNEMDMCPDTPKGTKVGAKGCSLILDSDQDGILDDMDKCADTPLTDKVDDQGCSVFIDKEVSVSLRVLFDNNSSNINNPTDQEFVNFATFMSRFPNTKAVIEGHSSAAGEAEYNQMLSEKRARAVVKLLVSKYAIDSARLTAIGYGESRLLDNSDTKAAHSINRRIEAKVTAMEKVKLLKQ
jgi:OOP family OmpA-OmpF porin